MERTEFKKLKDAELLAEYRSTGESRYFSEFFERYKENIRRACLKFFRGNMSLAEDATQDTFMKALQRAGDESITNIGGWLFTVARNSCIDIHRKECKVIQTFDPEKHQHSETVAVAPDGPEVEIQIKELLQKINRLGEKQRISLKLYLEGYSYTEIAGITRYSEKEVKSAIQTGKDHLKKMFGVGEA